MILHLCKLEYGHSGNCIGLCGETMEKATLSYELCNCEKCLAIRESDKLKTRSIPESLELDELKRIIGIAENCIISMKKQIGALKQENISAGELHLADETTIRQQERIIDILKQENEGLRKKVETILYPHLGDQST